MAALHFSVCSPPGNFEKTTSCHSTSLRARMPIPRTYCFRKRHQRPLITGQRLCYFWIIVAVLLLTSQPSYGVRILSNSSTTKYAAVGDSVTLSCHFGLAPEGLGHLDIEWSIKPLNISEEETTVAMCVDNRTYEDYYPFKDRAKFVSPDPASGDASIVIKELRPTDSAVYQCKVRKLNRLSSIRINLTVKARPAKPKCYVKSKSLEPCEVVLGCTTTEASTPILYSWVKENTENLLPVGAFADSHNGDLLLNQDIQGTFVCTVHGSVGVETCAIELESCNTEANTVTLLAVLAMFLTFPTVAIVVACCYKRNDTHFGNEILEDCSPPNKRLLME
ncbi:coxsackievirus and adenovirus receptor homolog [Solea solea]|uniref:coxsackievirus and adenovirus receptor homolog n=1 Tax=Solea solea TaxID=90069 RepID=UPI00272D9206|nr:coxsackievirus and adenovirus receptor homolog [Solea solea]